jgi:hypothetical protein
LWGRGACNELTVVRNLRMGHAVCSFVYTTLAELVLCDVSRRSDSF